MDGVEAALEGLMVLLPSQSSFYVMKPDLENDVHFGPMMSFELYKGWKYQLRV